MCPLLSDMKTAVITTNLIYVESSGAHRVAIKSSICVSPGRLISDGEVQGETETGVRDSPFLLGFSPLKNFRHNLSSPRMIL